MNQQINLYQPLFRRQKKVFTFRTLLQITAIAVLGMLLIYAYGHWQTRLLDQQLAQLQTREQTTVARLTTVSSQHPDASAAQAGLARLRDSLAAKQQLVARLANENIGNTQGFSAQMAGFARQTLNGLWLTDIELAAGGRELHLIGNTHAPELMPRYLQKLANEESLAGLRFREVRLSRPEESRYILFELATRLPDQANEVTQ